MNVGALSPLRLSSTVIRLLEITKRTSHQMALIKEIQEKIRADQFEFSKHATDQSIIRHISVAELRQAIENGEIIEDYPDVTV